MTDEKKDELTDAATDEKKDEAEKHISINKIYVKDFSFE